MSDVPNPEDVGKRDLDTIAQDLLGIDMSVTEFADVDDLVDDDLPPVESPRPGEPAEEPTGTVASSVEEPLVTTDEPGPGDAFDDDFGGGLGLLEAGADEHEPQPRAARTPPPGSRQSPPPAPAKVEQQPVRPAAEKQDRPARVEQRGSEPDEYWDALDGWDWEDGDSTTTDLTPSDDTVDETVAGDDVVEREEVYSRGFKPEEFLDDDEFGSGLEEDETSGSHRRRGPSRRDGEEDQQKSRGRRGGRRRGRKPRRPTAEGETDRDTGSVRESSAVDEGEGFGAGLDVEAGPETESSERTSRPQRSRDRGRRRRRPRDREPAVVEEDLSASSEPDDEHADESRERGRDRYRNVPSWEDAISCLVQIKRRSQSGNSADQQSSEKDGRRPDGSRQNRRRGSGRGRGRRRSSD